MIERISNRLRRINAEVYPSRIFQGPKWLVLGVNNICNLHCKMCDVGVSYSTSNFYTNLMGSTPKQMPITLFKKIVDEAAALYPTVKLGYAFTEPLIYSHLEESLVYANQKSMWTSITTNGLGLAKWAKVITENNVKELNISLDGPAEIHNFIRGNEHSFSKAQEGVFEIAKRSKTIALKIFCVITEWNSAHLIQFLQSLESWPIASVGFMHANFTSDATANLHNLKFGHHYPATASNVSDTDNAAINLEELWEQMREVKSKSWNFDVNFFPEIQSKERLKEYYLSPEHFFGNRCLDIFSNIMIKSNGDVIPAHGRCYNLTIGNLHNAHINEIWNSAIVSEFRKTVVANGGLLPACSRCCSSFSN